MTTKLKTKKWKWLIWTLATVIGVAVGVIIFFVIWYFVDNNSSHDEHNTTWNRNDAIREKNKQYAIIGKVENATNSGHTTSEIKSIYTKNFKSNEGSKKSTVLGGWNYTFTLNDEIFYYSTNFMNALEEFDDDILGWKAPNLVNGKWHMPYSSNIVSPLNTAIKTKILEPKFNGATLVIDKNGKELIEGTIPDNKAFIWFAGGPIGDYDESQTNVATYIFNPFAKVYSFRQSQYGFVPRETVILDYFISNENSEDEKAIRRVFKKQTKENIDTVNKKFKNGKKRIWKIISNNPKNSKSDINKIEEKIKNFTLTNEEAISILEGEINISLDKQLLSSSIAFIKEDANNAIKLKNQIEKNDSNLTTFYAGGISYGFSETINLLLNSNRTLPFDKLIASSNSLRATIPGSLRATGGWLDKDQESSFKGSSGTLDPTFFYSIQLEKFVFGQLTPLRNKMDDNLDYKTMVKNKVLFTYNEKDWNIGNITLEEKKFYNDCGLKHFAIDTNKGHNNIPLKEYINFLIP